MRIQVVLSKETEEAFRKHLGQEYGYRKGAISLEIEKILREHLMKPSKEGRL
jgi:hypothetical protein